LRDAIVIILAVSLSCLPNLIPPMLFGPIQSNHQILTRIAPFILVFFYGATVLSCYYLYELSILTGLSTYPEIAYYLGGGRASIIFIGGCLASFFVSQPSSFIVQINLLLRSFIHYLHDHQEKAIDRSDILISNITTLVMIILLYPLCMMKSFLRMRVSAFGLIYSVDLRLHDPGSSGGVLRGPNRPDLPA